MMLNPKEAGRFWDFLGFVQCHQRNSYRLVFSDGSVINALYDTDCESDNCLDEDDPDYEEFWIIVFKNIETDELFEISYHNMPEEVYCDGEKVFFNETND